VGRVGDRHDERPRRVTSQCDRNGLCSRVVSTRGGDGPEPGKVRAPVRELHQLVRGVHEVARKMETRLVKEAAAHRQAFAGGEGARNGELQDCAAGRAVASLEQHHDEGAESVNQLAGGDVVTTPQYRPAGIGSWRNGVSDTDGRNDGLT
jgi:hypothetical protein